MPFALFQVQDGKEDGEGDEGDDGVAPPPAFVAPPFCLLTTMLQEYEAHPDVPGDRFMMKGGLIALLRAHGYGVSKSATIRFIHVVLVAKVKVENHPWTSKKNQIFYEEMKRTGFKLLKEPAISGLCNERNIICGSSPADNIRLLLAQDTIDRLTRELAAANL